MVYVEGKMEPTKFTFIGETDVEEIAIERCHGKSPRLLGDEEGMQLECPVCGRKSQVFTIKLLGDDSFISKDFYQSVEEWNRGMKNHPREMEEIV